MNHRRSRPSWAAPAGTGVMRGVMRVAGVLVGTACSPKPPATPSATLLATWQTARVIMTLDDAPTGRRLRDNLTFTSAEPLGLAGP